jgi:hypothetical protein
MNTSGWGSQEKRPQQIDLLSVKTNNAESAQAGVTHYNYMWSILKAAGIFAI